MKNRTLGLVATISSAIFFGFMPLLLKTVYANGGNSITITFLRFFFVVPVLFVILKIKGISLKVSKEELKKLLLLAFFGYAGTSMLLFSSYQFIPSGMATTIHFLYPTVTVVGMVVFFKEKIQAKKIICVFLCLFGVIMFYEPEGGSNFLGILLALSSSFTYGFYTIYYGKSGLKKMESLKCLFYMNCTGMLMYGLAGGLTGNLVFELKPIAWVVMITVSCATTLIGSLGYQLGVKNIGSENTAMLSTIEPITSVIVGVIVYDEAFGIKTVLGCLAILTAAIIIAKMKEE